MSDGSFFTRVEKKPRSVESKRLRTRVKITEHAIAENNASRGHSWASSEFLHHCKTTGRNTLF